MMKIEVHPSLEVSPRQVNKGWCKHKGELKKAFEEFSSEVKDRLSRTKALKWIGIAFPLGSGCLMAMLSMIEIEACDECNKQS